MIDNISGLESTGSKPFDMKKRKNERGRAV
jgi:hypothetical protein